jgi:DNA polymerase alpha subunit B
MLPVKRESSLSTPSDYANKTAKITYRDSPTPSPSYSNQGSREGSPMTVPNSQDGETFQKASYKDRTDSGKVLVKMNETLGPRGEFEPSTRNSLGMRCKLEADEDDFSNVPERYRYMFTTLEERSRAFEKHFKTMQDAMCELASISPEDLIPVGVPSQDPFWVCGRVCCDASEGKINEKSVLLEGSRRESAGRRIHLDLQVDSRPL